MLKYNGSILKVNNGQSIIGSVTFSPVCTKLFEHTATISGSSYGMSNIPWTDYDCMMFQFDYWTTSSSVAAALDNENGWRLHIRRYDSWWNSNTFGIEIGGWGAGLTADAPGVSTSSYNWSTYWCTIPGIAGDVTKHLKVIIDRTTGYLYVYMNGVLQAHRTGFNDYQNNMYFRTDSGANFSNCYIVGGPSVQDLVDWTP